MKRWIVRERVVLEYVWGVLAKDAAGARKVCEVSDECEATCFRVERKFRSVRQIKKPREIA